MIPADLLRKITLQCRGPKLIGEIHQIRSKDLSEDEFHSSPEAVHLPPSTEFAHAHLGFG